jgi:hypothetical protein
MIDPVRSRRAIKTVACPRERDCLMFDWIDQLRTGFHWSSAERGITLREAAVYLLAAVAGLAATE